MKKGIAGSLKYMLDIYINQRVTRGAAALSYFLTLSIFPLLIFVNAILGSLNVSEESLFGVWKNIIPPGAMSLIGDYLSYVGGNKSVPMIAVGLGVMLTSSSAAFRTIMTIMEDIQGKSRFTGVFGAVLSFVVSLAFLAVIYLSGLIIITGDWFADLLENSVGIGFALSAWQWLRFLVLLLILFTVILFIYLITAPREKRKIRRMPGALLAALMLVVVSMIFSRLISMSVRYELVYGSLASFIILMVWMYTCSIILVMGNVFNIAFPRSTAK